MQGDGKEICLLKEGDGTGKPDVKERADADHNPRICTEQCHGKEGEICEQQHGGSDGDEQGSHHGEGSGDSDDHDDGEGRKQEERQDARDGNGGRGSDSDACTYGRADGQPGRRDGDPYRRSNKCHYRL